MSQEKQLNYLMFHLVSSICDFLDKEIVLKIGLTLGLS